MNQIVSTPTVFPCNRGVVGGERGYHNFIAQPGGVPTCTYCGAQPDPQAQPVRWQPATYMSHDTRQPGSGAVETSR